MCAQLRHNFSRIFTFLQLRSQSGGKVQSDEKTGNKKDQQKAQPTAQKGASANKKSKQPTKVDNAKTKYNAKSKQPAQSNSNDDAKKSALKMQKNHFNDKSDVKERSLAEDLKTDAGAASDESWEKDFDLND